MEENENCQKIIEYDGCLYVVQKLLWTNNCHTSKMTYPTPRSSRDNYSSLIVGPVGEEKAILISSNS